MDDDLLLSRFLDGELDDAEMAAFEARLGREPELAARLEGWLANDRAVVNDIEALLSAGSATPMQSDPAPVDLAAYRAERSDQAKDSSAAKRWFVPASIAASLALAGLISFSVLRSDADNSLELLETLPTGQTAATADGGELTAVLTFASADGRWCREFALNGQGSGQGSGIACREDGAWQLQGELAEGAAASAGPSAGYATAAGTGPSSLDAIYSRLGAGDPLGMGAEAELMQNGWTKRPG